MRSIVQPGVTTSSHAPGDRAWYVRGYQPTDEPSLRLLYQDVFGRTRDAAQLHWKLFARGNWPGQMVWVAVEKSTERVVGHYAGIPLVISIGGMQYKGIHSVEAMAHPDFRRQGILTALGTSAHSEWASVGFEIVIGLPNDKWGSRNAALGYIPLFPFVWLKFPLRLDRIIERHVRSELVRGLAGGVARLVSELWQFRHFGNRRRHNKVHVSPLDLKNHSADIENLWAAVGSQYPSAVVRSPEWLRWRYAEEPSGGFKVLSSTLAGRTTGLAAYRVIKDGKRTTGYLADLIVAPDDRDSLRALLAAVFADVEKSGAGSMMAASPPGSPIYEHLIGSGFRHVDAAFTFEIVPLTARINPNALKESAHWHLAAGDFDIV